MFQTYAWRGKPIPDIRAWARERGEQMVVVEHYRKDPWTAPPYYLETREEEEMPDSFWRGHMAGHAGGGTLETWTELRRYDP
jgi:hypothetical protein